MHIVTVVFDIALPHFAEFMPAMLANAAASLSEEPGCKQFDVCESETVQGTVFLYEVYDSAQSFQAHLLTPHFLAFDALTKTWVKSKEVKVYKRLLSAPVSEKS